MSSIDKEVSLLLAESGGWLVGMDARDVKHIDSWQSKGIASHTPPPEVADLLGGRQDTSFRTPQRSLLVTRGSEKRTVLVDRTLGTEFVAVSSMYPVPKTLRCFGAPAWWLGMTWIDKQIVLLVDLFHAVVDQG